MLALAASVVLVMIAVAHSVLGESTLLRPLFAGQWKVGVPRRAAERIFRFAWHLTSVAWVGLAATLLGVTAVDAIALVALISGLLIFFTLRAHLAWPMFFFVAAAAWASVDALPTWVVFVVVLSAAIVAGAAATLHLYWAVGGRWALATAVPEGPTGAPAFQPGPVVCTAVALAGLGLVVMLCWPLWGSTPSGLIAPLGFAAVLLTARSVGDGRQSGFSKTNRKTAYARADDAIYTPLFTLLLFGTLGALYLISFR